MSVVGAVIVFVGALLFTMVVFPEYFAEVREAGRQALLAEGKTPEEVQKVLDLAAPMQTPFVNALLGAVMTILSGFIMSLAIPFIVRKRTPAAPQG
jgi:Zn-dependent membrane protease YugP